MRIALAQMRVLPARPEQNFKTIRDRIEQAKSLNCHIVAFPEMCVGGYLLGDLWTDDVWCEYLDGFNEKIREISDGIVVIYGNVRLDKKKVNKDGRCRKYNAGLAWYNRKPVLHKSIIPQGIAIKSLLPNYRIFDDERYFFSLQEISLDVDVPIGQLLQPFELTIEGKSYRIGVEICEDLWFNDYRYRGRPLNISRYLVGNGAQCIFNLSSSPWTWGKDQARNNRIRDSINDCDSFVPFYYVNCVGVQNNGKNIVVFDGDSTVYNEKGQVVIAAAKPYEEELIVFNDNPLIAGETKKQPELVEAKYQAIIQGIKGMDEIMGSSTFPYIIGLSGGIDSALVACLVTAAVGKKRIIACNLPTRYNSAQTRSIAGQVAKALGISLHTIPIEEIVSMNEHLVEQFHPTGFHRENIQAKIRGTTILSNIAGITGGLLTCNGNKIEIALGYATLYGDVNGALAPIGDLLKTEIFRMAQYVNTQIFNETVIPASLIPDELFTFDIAPSAELRSNQIDPMKWGYHDALIQTFNDFRKTNPETILRWYREGTLCKQLQIDPSLLNKYSLNNPRVFIDDLEWVVRSMQKAVFKRIQAPPIIILSRNCYGYDIRESQLPIGFTENFHFLKEKILSTGTGK